MSDLINVRGKKYPLNKPEQEEPVMVAGTSRDVFTNSGVVVSQTFYTSDLAGKAYPGEVNYTTQRVLAYKNSTVRSVVNSLVQKAAKLPFKIVPKRDEPPRQIHVLNYNIYNLESHPAFDSGDVVFLMDLYQRLDPKGYITDKRSIYDNTIDEFTQGEQETVEYLQQKHDDFYRKREKDKREIEDILRNPDPWFTKTRTWEGLVRKVLFDLLTIDRGVLFIIRDEAGKIRGLMPTDSAWLRPIIDQYGFIDTEKAYVQVVHGAPHAYFNERDTIVMMMHPVTDMRFFGYGVSKIETLYQQILADLYIDKGNFDYYRKGGSIPEGFISIEPPASKDGIQQQVSQAQLHSIQRDLQSIMMGDFTQVPIVSGGKISWIDFKGKRRDMQFKELAVYIQQKIFSLWNVSPQDLGLGEGGSRASAEVQADLTRSSGMEPILRTLSEYITEHVIKEFRPEDDLKLWFESDDLETEKLKWNMEQQQLVTGASYINEWRASRGLHPVPWGDTPLQGRVNWKPEEDQEPSPFAPEGMGDLPPLPDMANPGGPVGGANPLSGAEAQPKQGENPLGSPDSLKSLRYFAMSEVEEMDVSALMETDYYKAAAKFEEEYKSLESIHEYPGASEVRNPVESYEFFASSNHIILNTVDQPDTGNPMIFSNYDGNGIVTVADYGDEPIIKSLGRAYYDSLPEETRAAVNAAVTEENLRNEVFERLVFKNLDQNLQNTLYEDYYKFRTFSTTDAEVEQVEELL